MCCISTFSYDALDRLTGMSVTDTQTTRAQ
jgi:YD repeat-containing protein